MISGNMVGSYSQIGKTFILVDEDGNEITGICVDNPVVFTAGDNDVRENFVYAGDSGVSVGTKVIPIYYAGYGKIAISSGKNATITTPEYNYSNLIAVISTFDKNISQSVASTYVSVDDAMYIAGSNTKVSDIVVDKESRKIDLGVTVDKNSILRYLIIREEY